VAGLRASGIIAPLVLDGPRDGPTFRAYVEQALAPALAPGDVVVLDNLPAHKVAGVKAVIAGRGASLMYLPPIARTSTRLGNSLQSSKPCCASLQPAHAPASGAPSARPWMLSPQPNAATTTGTQAMSPSKTKML
jgi:hypothetical protein